MCVSRLHRVLRHADGGAVDVESMDGAVHRASLLALDGPAPVPGDWLVVHSGYALERVDAKEAEGVASELLSGISAARTRTGAADEKSGPARDIDR